MSENGGQKSFVQSASIPREAIGLAGHIDEKHGYGCLQVHVRICCSRNCPDRGGAGHVNENIGYICLNLREYKMDT